MMEAAALCACKFKVSYKWSSISNAVGSTQRRKGRHERKGTPQIPNRSSQCNNLGASSLFLKLVSYAPDFGFAIAPWTSRFSEGRVRWRNSLNTDFGEAK